MKRFTPEFKRKAKEAALRLGLVNITTKRMKSLMFSDLKADVKYGLYPSGYIRRFITCEYYPGCPPYHPYQLNPVLKLKWPDGRTNTERVMLTPEEQLLTLKRAVKNYRKR